MRLLISVPLQVLVHPANRHHRVRALSRSVAWQLYRRFCKNPLERRVYGGLRVRLYPGDGEASNMFYLTEFHEYDVMHFTERYLRAGDGVLDGGANIGTFSLLATSVVGVTGRIDAFEPAPLFASRARENVSLNALLNVHVHELVIAEGSRATEFRVDLGVGNRELAAGEDGDTVSAQCVTLDEWPPDAPSYALAKLDLEGNELAALLGARKRLSRGDPPVWIIEATDSQLARYGHCRDEVFDLLEESGFELARYDGLCNQLFFGRGEARKAHDFFAIARVHRESVCARIAQARLETDWIDAGPAPRGRSSNTERARSLVRRCLEAGGEGSRKRAWMREYVQTVWRSQEPQTRKSNLVRSHSDVQGG
jgi:FkbM family methyltransferase